MSGQYSISIIVKSSEECIILIITDMDTYIVQEVP